MQRAEPATSSSSRATRTWAERVFGRWWRRQSAAHQDRYATLGPLASVLLFLAAIVSAFWYLRNEEFEREQEAVRAPRSPATLRRGCRRRPAAPASRWRRRCRATAPEARRRRRLGAAATP